MEHEVEDDDDYITALVAATTEQVEHEIRRPLLAAGYRLAFDGGWPPYAAVRLPRQPVISVGNLEYRDTAGADQVLAPAAYDAVTGEGGLVQLLPTTVWPDTDDRPEAAVINFTAGMATEVEGLPPRALHMVKLLLGHWYEHREAVITGTITTPMPLAYKRMLWTLRDTQGLF